MKDDTKQTGERMDAFEARLEAIEATQKEALAATLDGNRDAREILEMFQAVKGGMKVLGWLGVAIKWVATIGGAVMALYGLYSAAMHPGAQMPKP